MIILFQVIFLLFLFIIQGKAQQKYSKDLTIQKGQILILPVTNVIKNGAIQQLPNSNVTFKVSPMHKAKELKAKQIKVDDKHSFYYSSDQQMFYEQIENNKETQLIIRQSNNISISDANLNHFDDLFSYLTQFKLKLEQHCNHTISNKNITVFSCKSRITKGSQIIFFNVTNTKDIKMVIQQVQQEESVQDVYVQSTLYKNYVFVHYKNKIEMKYVFQIYEITNNKFTFIQSIYIDLRLDKEFDDFEVIKVQIMKQYQHISLSNKLTLNILILEKTLGLIIRQLTLGENQPMSVINYPSSSSSPSSNQEVFQDLIQNTEQNIIYLFSNSTLYCYQYQGSSNLNLVTSKDYSPLSIQSIFSFMQSITVVLHDPPITTHPFQYIQSYQKINNQLQLTTTVNYLSLPYLKRQHWNKHKQEDHNWQQVKYQVPYLLQFDIDNGLIRVIQLQQLLLVIKIKEQINMNKTFMKEPVVVHYMNMDRLQVEYTFNMILQDNREDLELYQDNTYITRTLKQYQLNQQSLTVLQDNIQGAPYKIQSFYIPTLTQNNYIIQYNNDTIHDYFTTQTFGQLTQNDKFWLKKYLGKQNYMDQNGQVLYLLFIQSSPENIKIYICHMDINNWYLDRSNMECEACPPLDLTIYDQDKLQLVDIRTDKFNNNQLHDLFSMTLAFKKRLLDNSQFNQCYVSFLQEIDIELSNWANIQVTHNFTTMLGCQDYYYLSKTSQTVDDNVLMLFVDEDYQVRINVYDQFFNELNQCRTIQLEYPQSLMKVQIIAFNLQVVYTNYNPINIKKEFVKIFSYCNKNNMIFYANYDVKQRQIQMVTHIKIHQLNNKQLKQGEIQMIASSNSQSIILIISKYNLIVEYQLQLNDKTTLLELVQINHFHFPFHQFFGSMPISVGITHGHMLVQSRHHNRDNKGLIFDLSKIQDFKSNCIQVIDNLVHGEIDDFISDQSIAMVLKSFPKEDGGNRISFHKYNNNKYLKIINFNNETLQQGYFDLILKVQSLMDEKQTLNITFKFNLPMEYDANINNNKIIAKYEKQQVELKQYQYKLENGNFTGNIIRYLLNDLQGSLKNYQIKLTNYLDKSDYSCKIDDEETQMYDYYSQFQLQANLDLRINNLQMNISNSEYDKSFFQLIYQYQICSLNIFHTDYRDRCYQNCQTLHHYCYETFQFYNTTYIICKDEKFSNKLIINLYDWEKQTLGKQQVAVQHEEKIQKYNSLIALNTRLIVRHDKTILRIYKVTDEVLGILFLKDIEINSEILPMDEDTNIQFTQQMNQDVYMFIFSKGELHLIIFDLEFEIIFKYNLQITQSLRNYGISVINCKFDYIDIEKTDDNSINLFINSKFCNVYEFQLRVSNDQKQFDFKFTGLYKKQVGLITPEFINKKIIISQNKLFKILSDDKDVLQLIEMYYRLDYKNNRYNQRSESICSTNLYENKPINQLRISDFKYYKVKDKEYLIIIFGLSAQRYEIHENMYLKYQKSYLQQFIYDKTDKKKDDCNNKEYIYTNKSITAYNNINSAQTIYNIKFKNEWTNPKQPDNQKDRQIGFIILIIIFTLLLIGILLFILFYRRKIEKLKKNNQLKTSIDENLISQQNQYETSSQQKNILNQL